MYSIPGSESSNIRSVYTGSIEVGESDLTHQCISRYGVQDMVGNVKEWVTDQMVCESSNICTGITATNAASFGVTQIDASNSGMYTTDTIFGTYKLDGVRGPCNDTDLDGDCDSSDSQLDGWALADESYYAGSFTFPLGLPIRYDFIDVYGLQLKDQPNTRNFSKEFGSDPEGAFIINTAVAREFNHGEESVG